METSALESTNVESAFLEVLTGELSFYLSLINIEAQQIYYWVYLYRGVKTSSYLKFKILDFNSL